MPLTDFWHRWRRRLLPLDEDVAKPPNLHETEKRRDAATRQAGEELTVIVATTPKRPEG